MILAAEFCTGIQECEQAARNQGCSKKGGKLLEHAQGNFAVTTGKKDQIPVMLYMLKRSPAPWRLNNLLQGFTQQPISKFGSPKADISPMVMDGAARIPKEPQHCVFMH